MQAKEIQKLVGVEVAVENGHHREPIKAVVFVPVMGLSKLHRYGADPRTLAERMDENGSGFVGLMSYDTSNILNDKFEVIGKNAEWKPMVVPSRDITQTWAQYESDKANREAYRAEVAKATAENTRLRSEQRPKIMAALAARGIEKGGWSFDLQNDGKVSFSFPEMMKLLGIE